jgi:hypothetical protein
MKLFKFFARKKLGKLVLPLPRTGYSKTMIPIGSRNTPPYQGPSKSFLSGQTSSNSLYRYFRDNIPLIGAGVWAWCNLCNTPISIRFESGSTPKLDQILDQLEARILQNPYQKGRNFSILLQQFYLELFTCGNCAPLLHFRPDKSIDYVEFLETSKISFEKPSNGRLKAIFKDESDEKYLFDEESFYYSLQSDYFEPAGKSMLQAIPWVLEIEETFLEDMSRSSHNSGFPRLHIKIEPPEPQENEEAEAYTKRADDYFDHTVETFKTLEIDDNCFTWNNISIDVIGGASKQNFSWKINREQLIEDVITALKLYPWVLGRSHGTTKEWVRSQYNLLMQEVDAVQMLGKSFLQNIIKAEYSSMGLDVAPSVIFQPNKDPFEKERIDALATTIQNFKNLKLEKVITEDEFHEMLRERLFQM